MIEGARVASRRRIGEFLEQACTITFSGQAFSRSRVFRQLGDTDDAIRLPEE